MSRGIMRQCYLTRDKGQVCSSLVVWLPQQFAEKGKYLKLLTQGSWSNGWKVEQVFSHVLGVQEVKERSRDHLRQRKASDI